MIRVTGRVVDGVIATYKYSRRGCSDRHARLLDVSVRFAQFGQHLRAVHIVRVAGVVDAQAVGHQDVPVRCVVDCWTQCLRHALQDI